MIRLIILFIILAGLGAVAWFTMQWWKARAALQALRNRPPSRIPLTIKLPREAEKSNLKMARFWSRLERLVPWDEDSIEGNDNVISAALIGTGAPEGQVSKVQFMLWVPPGLLERVKMELSECYDGEAQISEIKPEEDPLGEWARAQISYKQWLQQQENKDPEEAAQPDEYS